MIRGKEAVLMILDSSRIYKNANQEDTQILGTTGFAAAGAVWAFAVRRTCGYLCAWCLTEYYADRRTSIEETGEWTDGAGSVQRCTMVNPEKRYKNILHLMEAL